MLSIKFMYMYVEFYRNIYLEFVFNHLYMIKHMLWIITSEWQFLYYFCENPNLFQYSYVTINQFSFIINNTTAVQIIFCEGNLIKLANNCNTIVGTVKIIFQLNQCWIWIYVKKGIILFFLPSILYMIFCIVGFPSLLNDSMPHLEQI